MLQERITQDVYLSKTTLWLMILGAGVVVANIYYNQPLLGMIARDLNLSEEAASRITMFTQIGYASGLLTIVPLGDMFKRKKIILASFALNIIMLLSFGLSSSYALMSVLSFMIGITSVLPQLFIPIVAQLSAPKQKDKNVGMVVSGLLIGILASRVLSGWIGGFWGWRQMFYIAAAIIMILSIFIYFLLPDIQPTFRGRWIELMKSSLHFARTIPCLQLAAIRGALGFGSFSVFWTALVFHIEQPPFNAGSQLAGTLSVFGIAGALSASLVGKIADKVNKVYLIAIALFVMVISWLLFGLAGYTYAGLILGIIFIDMGSQSMHVTNQTIIYSIHPEASNRLNSVYMTSYFIGGAAGNYLGGWSWDRYGWNGVVNFGMGMVILCLAIHLLLANRPYFQAGNEI